MRYVAAYLLAVLGGNSSPSEADLKKILSSVGIDADSVCMKKVISELNGKNLEEVMAEGRSKLASVPSGGGAAVASGGGGASAGDAGGAAEKKEEKAPEPESESDDDMGFGLFD